MKTFICTFNWYVFTAVAFFFTFKQQWDTAAFYLVWAALNHNELRFMRLNNER